MFFDFEYGQLKEENVQCVLCDVFSGVDQQTVELFRSDDLVIRHALKRDAPLHLLAVPRLHAPTIVSFQPGVLGAMLHALVTTYQKVVATGLRIDGIDYPGEQFSGGYRLVINCGEDGGQSVPEHLHVHLVAGIAMGGLKTDQRLTGDHIGFDAYPAQTVLGRQVVLEYDRLLPGQWVFIQTTTGVYELRYFAGTMFYWRQENVHVAFHSGQRIACDESCTVTVLWPQLLTGSDRSATRMLGVITGIVIS